MSTEHITHQNTSQTVITGKRDSKGIFLEDTIMSKWSMETGYNFLGSQQQQKPNSYTMCNSLHNNFGCIHLYILDKEKRMNKEWKEHENPYISLQTFMKDKTSVMRVPLHISHVLPVCQYASVCGASNVERAWLASHRTTQWQAHGRQSIGISCFRKVWDRKRIFHIKGVIKNTLILGNGFYVISLIEKI